MAVLTYALIATLLLLLRLDYSRVQFLGSGLLVLLWMSSVAHFRTHSLARIYVVMPQASIAEMPVVNSCRWLNFDEAQRRRLRVDAIVTDLNADFDKGQLALLAEAAISGVPVLDRRYMVELLTGRTPLRGLTPNEFGALLPSRQYLVLRRAVELGLTVLLLPAIVPILLVVAFLVWMDSPGPVFFMQTRIGRRGEPFKMIKFRTMFHGAVGPGFTQAHDPRITRLGSFLRKYRLDELPQTFNILGGDMSWVGPRPEAESLDRGYVRNIEHFALRGIVRPGVTGWAQINQDYGYAHERMRSKLE